MSSAGLRVFMVVQKDLKKVGGEIILSAIAEGVSEIFRMSGFMQVFPGYPCCGGGNHPARNTGRYGGVDGGKGQWPLHRVPGAESGERLSFFRGVPGQSGVRVLYGRRCDLCRADGDGVRGAALRPSGLRTDEYKDLFGEFMVVKNNFFFFPAVKHPSVDFVLHAHKDPGLTYKVLHGFGFKGPLPIPPLLSGRRGGCRGAFIPCEDFLRPFPWKHLRHYPGGGE